MRGAILSGILFLSGISALIFETLWLRLSGLTFGNPIWSAALILSSFMAGMALGNAFAAPSRVQRWRPLRLYAFLEQVIASLGCTSCGKTTGRFRFSSLTVIPGPFGTGAAGM
jgi:predicted membrane-bound spermidine synthase